VISLITNWYADPFPERAMEIAHCLTNNLANAVIDRVLLWCNSDRFVGGKITAATRSDRRPDFRDLFDLANSHSGPDDLNVIANADIILEESGLRFADRFLKPGDCFALSRWDLQFNGPPRLHREAFSQDAWMFRGPIRPIVADFGLGVPGCDNRLIHELRAAGYAVSNPALTVRAFHLHLSAIRTYERDGFTAVPKPHEGVEIS